MEIGDIAAELGLPVDRVWGWGLSTSSGSAISKPTSVDEVARILTWASEHGVPVAFRGSGCSYGDASQNEGGIVLDATAFARIKSFDIDSGLLVAEPGVTLEQIWRRSVPMGWWPPVVSGTMYPTLGGLLSMNVHGKNNWQVGTIGSWVRSFRLLTVTSGELLCSPEENADLFYAAIGGFGMLGCFTEVTLQLKKIYSGCLDVEAIATPDLQHMISFFDTEKDNWDYLVGWVDCFPRGKRLGRGLVHAARYLAEGEDENPRESMSVDAQDLPMHLLGVVPKAVMWRFLKPFMNNFGMRALNAAKYHSGVFSQTRGRPHRQSHAAFAFLLDYVPDWKKAYGKGGLIQYQTFVPRERAHEVHPQLIALCHDAGMVPYLGVYKRHRPDSFLMTHAVDGFSFAMDFKVTAANRERLWQLTHRLDGVLADAGGRLYFAKDATMLAETAGRIWPAEVLGRFKALKERYDPDGLLQTNLSRRVFPEFTDGTAG